MRGKGITLNFTPVEKFNQGITHKTWKSEKTIHAEEWMRRESHSRYLEGKTYEWKNEHTDDGGLLQEGTEEEGSIGLLGRD